MLSPSTLFFGTPASDDLELATDEKPVWSGGVLDLLKDSDAEEQTDTPAETSLNESEEERRPSPWGSPGQDKDKAPAGQSAPGSGCPPPAEAPPACQPPPPGLSFLGGAGDGLGFNQGAGHLRGFPPIGGMQPPREGLSLTTIKSPVGIGGINRTNPDDYDEFGSPLGLRGVQYPSVGIGGAAAAARALKEDAEESGEEDDEEDADDEQSHRSGELVGNELAMLMGPAGDGSALAFGGQPGAVIEANDVRYSQLPSIGSANHFTGNCDRCCFHPKGRCLNGFNCQHCHFDHEKRKRKNKKKNKAKQLSSLCSGDEGEEVLSTTAEGSLPLSPDNSFGRSFSSLQATGEYTAVGTLQQQSQQQQVPSVPPSAPPPPPPPGLLARGTASAASERSQDGSGSFHPAAGSLPPGYGDFLGTPSPQGTGSGSCQGSLIGGPGSSPTYGAPRLEMEAQYNGDQDDYVRQLEAENRYLRACLAQYEAAAAASATGPGGDKAAAAGGTVLPTQPLLQTSPPRQERQTLSTGLQQQQNLVQGTFSYRAAEGFQLPGRSQAEPASLAASTADNGMGGSSAAAFGCATTFQPGTTSSSGVLSAAATGTSLSSVGASSVSMSASAAPFVPAGSQAWRERLGETTDASSRYCPSVGSLAQGCACGVETAASSVMSTAPCFYPDSSTDFSGGRGTVW